MSTSQQIVAALETARAFIADELETRRQSFLPDATEEEQGYIASAESALAEVESAIASGEARQ